ncbi:MAG: RDD family protein [Desulfuromonadales bacterium]|nr:RDD family protein [Desulfuromonadales bacterium]
MRCPKCGYNSFDHLDSCKKCGKDLLEHKQHFGIVSVLFPGQMKPGGPAVAVAEESATVDAAVAVAATDSVAEDSATEVSSAGDDFGFDFMGDSEEDEDLSFDELFEEASADEDVEETLPAPDQEAAPADTGEEFAFDPGEGESDADEDSSADTGLDDDFGFDPADDSVSKETSSTASEDDLQAEDFEPPPATAEEFTFSTDEVEFEESEGTEEDPKDPFELPESPQVEGAPETDLFGNDPSLAIVTEKDDGLLRVKAADVKKDPDDAVVDDFSTTEDSAPLANATVEDVQEPLADFSVSVQEEDGKLPQASTPMVETAAAELTAGTMGEPAPPEIAGPTVEPDLPIAPPAVAGSALLPPLVSRISAFCCDLLLLVIVGMSFIIAAEAAIAVNDGSLLPSLETLIDLSVVYFLVLFFLAFGYFTMFHFLAGQTPGKMLVGLRVETLAGESLLFSQAFLRSVGGLLQLLPVGLGYLAILASADQRGWNDRLAGTRLIALKGLSEET